MSDSHDQGAIDATSTILNKIRSSDQNFSQIFSNEFCRTGFTGWPKPDAVFKDYFENNEITLALEYKPPDQDKREYMTGVGQAISYLHHNDYSGLIIPKVSKDSFKISDFIVNLFEKRSQFEKLPICIFDYDSTKPIGENNLFLRKSIKYRNDYKVEKKEIKTKVFWAWWREISNFELFDILSLCRKYNNENTDIYTNFVWPSFKEKLESGKALTWEGIARERKSIPAGEKQNYKIPLFQLDLIDQDTGHLTQLGFRFLNLCEQRGPNNEIFLNSLASHILNYGKHLQLIILLYKFQEEKLHGKKFNSKDFRQQFDNYLIEIGQVPPWEKRKPGRKTTGGKENYIRDEFKLWNKFNFLISNGKNYFREDYGLQFDWPKIIKCLNFDIYKFL